MNKKLFILATLAILSVFAGCKKTVLDEPKAAVPELTSIQPTSGIAGIPATITGKNFSTTASANEVYFGEAKAQVTAATATSLSVLVPENAAGQCAVSVKVGDKTATGLNFAYIEVQVEARVAGISPVEGTAGIDVTVNGEGFGTSAAAIKVMFGDAEAQVKSVADNAITVVAPDMAGTAQTVAVAVYKDEEIVPTPRSFTYKFDNELALGAIAGTIYAAGNIDTEEPDAIEVPLTLKKNGETATATEEDLEGVYLVPAKEGAQEVQIEQILVEDGVLKAYAPAGTKGDYSLKVVAKSAIPVVSEAKFCVYYVPKYALDLSDDKYDIGAYGAGSNAETTPDEKGKFASAKGLALAPDGSLWVGCVGGQKTAQSNNLAHAISKVNLSTKAISFVVNQETLTSDKTVNIFPYGLAFDSTGDCYVACKNGQFMIGKVAKGTNAWSTQVLTDTPANVYEKKGISFMNLIVDSNDNLYISDRDQARILKVNKGSTKVDGVISLETKINNDDNHVQVNQIAWFNQDKSKMLVAGAEDLYIFVTDLQGNMEILAGNGLKPHKYDGGDNASGTTLNFTDGTPGNTATACIGQIGGFYVDSDGYIYFTDINAEAIRVLVPGIGNDYKKGVVKTLHTSLYPKISSSKDGAITGLGNIVKVGDTFYFTASACVRTFAPVR